MTFEEILDQAIAMLQRRGRLTYNALKRQFQLDDATLDDLKEQLLYPEFEELRHTSASSRRKNKENQEELRLFCN